MRKYFLTLDLEEWYHLEYLKEFKYKINSQQKYVPKALSFLERMAHDGIHMTVFVLGCIAEENPELIKEIAEMGHEIACHGMEHDLVYKLSAKQFKERTKRAKEILESITGNPIIGYRAPCFSMENEKLSILWELGFVYDASLIRFKEHNLYNILDISGFDHKESMVFIQNNKYEFETPTLDIAGISIPISGGGYFRIFPLWLTKYFIKKHWEKEENFIFYIHPFELTSELLQNGRAIGWKNYFRFQVGRSNMQRRLIEYINWVGQRVEFMTFSDYISNYARLDLEGDLV